MFPQINSLLHSFSYYLEQHPFKGEPSRLYEAQNYILDLGGKRIRPVALLAALEATGIPIEKGLPAAWAFEVFHNFTLVHDDIMDKAPLRRGKPTVHKKYNRPTAILAGDNMLLYAYQKIEGYDAILYSELSKIISQTGILICEGQFLDMQFETQESVTEDEYLKMIELKTAVLLGACLQAGATIGGAKAEETRNLYEMGVNLGISFQIMDDILDAFSDDPKVGKIKGGDIIANKKTLLLIEALAIANPIQKKKITALLALEQFDAATKVQLMLDIYNELDIRNRAEAKMKFYYELAQQNYSNLSPKINKGGALKELMEYLQIRSH